MPEPPARPVFPSLRGFGGGGMPGGKQDESDEARLFYVAATRATHALYVTLSGEGEFGRRLPGAPQTIVEAVA